MNYSVYHIHVEPSLNLGYIGITKNTKNRFQQHTWKRKKSNRHLRFALKKYGDQIKFSVLASGLDKEAAELLEEILRPTPNIGWNITAGGGIPPDPSGKIRSEQYRLNISKAKMGEKNPMFGKKIIFSDAHKENLSRALMGKESATKGRPRPKLTCPHCGLEGGVGSMGRWHFDRCKNANI